MGFKVGNLIQCNGTGMLGKHHSEKTKQKMRKSQKGLQAGQKHPLYGTHLSKETKRKIGDANLGHIPWNKGKIGVQKHSEETIQKMKKIKTGKHHSEKTKQKMRETSLNLWQNEEHAKKMIELFQLKPNGIELYLDFLLQNYFPDEWKFVGDGEIILSGLCPDFINCNGKKLIIELFGDYWHNRKSIRYNYTEHGRKAIFMKYGYSTLIIWEYELTNEIKVIKKIRLFEEEHEDGEEEGDRGINGLPEMRVYRADGSILPV